MAEDPRDSGGQAAVSDGDSDGSGAVSATYGLLPAGEPRSDAAVAAEEGRKGKGDAHQDEDDDEDDDDEEVKSLVKYPVHLPSCLVLKPAPRCSLLCFCVAVICLRWTMMHCPVGAWRVASLVRWGPPAVRLFSYTSPRTSRTRNIR